MKTNHISSLCREIAAARQGAIEWKNIDTKDYMDCNALCTYETYIETHICVYTQKHKFRLLSPSTPNTNNVIDVITHNRYLFFFFLILFTYVYLPISTSLSLVFYFSPLSPFECVNEERKNELKKKNNVLDYVKQNLNVWCIDRNEHKMKHIIRAFQ